MPSTTGAAVEALGIFIGDHVLDMCCAPGAKLCMMAERVGPTGSVTGVDIAAERLNACKTGMQIAVLKRCVKAGAY